MKKQHRQALLLDNFLGVDGLATGRSLRDRKPVTYTFGKSKVYCDFKTFCGAGFRCPHYRMVCTLFHWSLLIHSVDFAVQINFILHSNFLRIKLLWVF